MKSRPAILLHTPPQSAAEGARARRDALAYLENPHFFEGEVTADALDAWQARCSAWAAGWLREDAGRSSELVSMLGRRRW